MQGIRLCNLMFHRPCAIFSFVCNLDSSNFSTKSSLHKDTLYISGDIDYTIFHKAIKKNVPDSRILIRIKVMMSFSFSNYDRQWSCNLYSSHSDEVFVIFASLLQPVPRPRLIDRLVIDGHVIPNEVLFTAPTPDNLQYPTLVFSDNLKVVISFSKSQNKGDDHRSSTLRFNHSGNRFWAVDSIHRAITYNPIKNTIVRDCCNCVLLLRVITHI